MTSAEFAAADFEAPIGDSSNVDCWTLGSLYQTAASEAEESGDGSALRVFALLALIANIHFKPEDRAEPYGPQSVFDGRRSMIPSDLRGTQSAVISEFVPTIRNPGLRARLATRSLSTADGQCASSTIALSFCRAALAQPCHFGRPTACP